MKSFVSIKKYLKDYVMALLVICLAIIDIIILLIYTVAEAVRDNLGVKLTANQEMPEEYFGVSYKETRHFFQDMLQKNLHYNIAF